ncbi:Hypothetical predicted protein, partial [Pelobates cultripes]
LARSMVSANMANYSEDCSDISDDFTSGTETHHPPAMPAPLPTHPRADTSP